MDDGKLMISPVVQIQGMHSTSTSQLNDVNIQSTHGVVKLIRGDITENSIDLIVSDVTRSTQPGHPSVGRCNEYRPKGGDAQRLGVKADMVLFAGESLESETESESTVGIKTEVDDQFHDVNSTSCHKQFTDSPGLSVQIETEANSKTDLNCCPQCQKRCPSQQSLTRHNKYKCTECGKCCDTSTNLAAHMRTHSGEKPFECTVCSKRFSQLCTLTNHSRIHSGEKPYKCYICEKAFVRPGDLDRHITVHTGDKPYTCSQCFKSFRYSHRLQQHSRHVHDNLRQYDCPYCGKLLKTKIDLKSHVRTHTGAKPYSCKHCSDHFTRPNELKVHLLESHNEGTWFTCHICQKKFSRSRECRTHMLQHDEVKTYVEANLQYIVSQPPK